MFINLLPSHTRLKIQFRSLLRHYTLLWCCSGILLTVPTVIQLRHLATAGDQLEILEQQCRSVYAIENNIERDRAFLKSVQADLATLRQLETPNYTLDMLGALSKATRSVNGNVHIQRLSLQSGLSQAIANATTVVTAKPGVTPAALATLSLAGVADDDLSLAGFIESLRRVGVFTSIELKSSSQVAGRDRTSRQYQLECRFEELQ